MLQWISGLFCCVFWEWVSLIFYRDRDRDCQGIVEIQIMVDEFLGVSHSINKDVSVFKGVHSPNFGIYKTDQYKASLLE